MGRNYIANNPVQYGSIDSRPTDRRENYVKRCVGLPGQTLQIKNKIVYLDGKANKEPENEMCIRDSHTTIDQFYIIKLVQRYEEFIYWS